MARTVADVMTKNCKTVDAGATLVEAARIMRDDDVGAVIVTSGDKIQGIATDRDIVVRALADGQDPSSCKVSDICSSGVTTASPQDSVEDALRTMEKENIRRLPVVEGGRPVGLVSLGDLSEVTDTGDTLRDIAKAPADN